MSFEAFLKQTALVLTEGSIYERLRRHPSVAYDPYLAHGSLIYDASAARVLEQVHREYLDIGRRYGLPMIALTDTWRANKERIRRSRFNTCSVNQDNARFLCDIRAGYGPSHPPLFIGGLIACRGDAYRPDEALSREEAASFHAYQVRALAETGIDFLMAATLPASSEAHGMADAMAATDLPYILSFVLRPEGTLLDGTPFHQIIKNIDASVARPPVGYLINCVHPSIFRQALCVEERADTASTKRILGLQANTSEKSPEELDRMERLETENPETFARLMGAVHDRFGVPILGGCCGTDTRHIEALAGRYATPA
ncbi:MAG: homocysteine S-methyltransferase family protein [Rhodothermales bacterium]